MSTKIVDNHEEVQGLIDQAIELDRIIRRNQLKKEILEKRLEEIARSERKDNETVVALEDQLGRQVRFHWSARYEVRQDIVEELFKILDLSTWTELFSVSKVEIGRQRNFDKVLLKLDEKTRKQGELSFQKKEPKGPKVEYKY